MLGFPVHHQLLELAQTHVHQVSDAIQPSYPLLSHSQSFPESRSYPMSHLFISGGQSIGASASASVLQILKLQFLVQVFLRDYLFLSQVNV